MEVFRKEFGAWVARARFVVGFGLLRAGVEHPPGLAGHWLPHRMEPVASVWAQEGQRVPRGRARPKETGGIGSMLPETPGDAGGERVAAFWRSSGHGDAGWRAKGTH